MAYPNHNKRKCNPSSFLPNRYVLVIFGLLCIMGLSVMLAVMFPYQDTIAEQQQQLELEQQQQLEQQLEQEQERQQEQGGQEAAMDVGAGTVDNGSGSAEFHRYSFCGAFWTDARDNCNVKQHCEADRDCPEFEYCWTQTPCDYYAAAETPTTAPPKVSGSQQSSSSSSSSSTAEKEDDEGSKESSSANNGNESNESASTSSSNGNNSVNDSGEQQQEQTGQESKGDDDNEQQQQEEEQEEEHHSSSLFDQDDSAAAAVLLPPAATTPVTSPNNDLGIASPTYTPPLAESETSQQQDPQDINNSNNNNNNDSECEQLLHQADTDSNNLLDTNEYLNFLSSFLTNNDDTSSSKNINVPQEYNNLPYVMKINYIHLSCVCPPNVVDCCADGQSGIYIDGDSEGERVQEICDRTKEALDMSGLMIVGV